LEPLDKLPTDPSLPWFTNVLYGTTTMFRAGVPQKLVQQCTVHKSLEALHQYERPSENQLLDVSNMMSNSGKGASSTAVASISNQVIKNDTFSRTGIVPNIMFTGCSCSIIVPASDMVQNYSNGESLAGSYSGANTC